MSRLPALVAGFLRVLIMTKPGMTNFPALFTCFAPRLARASRILEHSDFFSSVSAARASAIPPLDRERAAAFMAFIDFMAFIALMGAAAWGSQIGAGALRRTKLSYTGLSHAGFSHR